MRVRSGRVMDPNPHGLASFWEAGSGSKFKSNWKAGSGSGSASKGKARSGSASKWKSPFGALEGPNLEKSEGSASN
jgi:hypothetical protein